MSSTPAFPLTFSDILPLLPEIIVAVMIVVVMMSDLFLSRIYRNIAYYCSQITVVTVFVLSWFLIKHTDRMLLDGQFFISSLTVMLKCFAYLATFLVFVYARPYLRTHKMHEGEYYILALSSLLGAMVLISAASLITMYIGLELMSLPLYAMAAMRPDQEHNGEAAVKYFIMGAVASGILLYGMSLLYAVTGHLDISGIVTYMSNHSVENYRILMLVSMVFMIVAVAFKLGAVPFHMWLPDVYEGTPNAVLVYLTSVPKLAAYGLLVMITTKMLSAFKVEWSQILIVLAVASMFIGNVVALVQDNIKRMFAYSTMSHVGYVMLGLAMADHMGYAGAMYYVIVYVVTAVGALGLLLLLSGQDYDADRLKDFSGLNQRNSWLAFMMLILLFSMAGIPPFAGFTAKLMVLTAVIAHGYYGLACYAFITSVIAAYYYLRVIKVMYFENPRDTTPISVPVANYVAISANCLIVFLFGIFPVYLTAAVNLIFPR